MTVLQATVEIVKASFVESKSGLQSLMNPDERAKLLEGSQLYTRSSRNSRAPV